MPRFLRPQTYSHHRVAAIALYRALLSRCISTPSLQDGERTSLANAIRNKFRQNRKLQSTRQLGLVFRAGYGVLDHLDASTTLNSKSVDFLKNLIQSLPRGITRAPPQRKPPPPPRDTSTKHPLAVLPPEKAVLNVRPYAKTSGPRHVPILASANGVPFLRLRKPQPESLSRVIRQKLARRMKDFDDKILCSHYWVPLASYEDEWDLILEQQCGFDEEDAMGHQGSELTWSHEFGLWEISNVTNFKELIAKDNKIAEKMMRLVDKETELALQEGETVVRGRKNNPIRSQWLK